MERKKVTVHLWHVFPRCAKHAIQFGAAINSRSLDENDTALHIAARHGLLAHVDLYLRHGAAAEGQNDDGQTPLNAACSQPHEHAALERYVQVCQRLVDAGADVSTSDGDRHTPLHMACKNANAGIVELLLKSGASVNVMDYGGEAPMHNILKMVAYKLEHEPERIVRALLNYGSIRVWPGALPKVSVHCFNLIHNPRSPTKPCIPVAVSRADWILEQSRIVPSHSLNLYAFLIPTLLQRSILVSPIY